MALIDRQRKSALDNVQAIRVLVPATGEWAEVVLLGGFRRTPAIITITRLRRKVATSTIYEILYAPTEAAWWFIPCPCR